MESIHIRSGEHQDFRGKMTSWLRLEGWMGVRSSLLGKGGHTPDRRNSAYPRSAKCRGPKKESTFEKPRVGPPNGNCLNPSTDLSDESCPPGTDWGHSVLLSSAESQCLLTSSVSLGKSLNLKVFVSSSAAGDSNVICPTEVWEWQGTQYVCGKC